MVNLIVAAAHAHDPYEITTRAYLYSDRLELRIEMEFSAAMLLVRSNAAVSDAFSPADEFATALPVLQARAGDFLRITANGEVLPVTGTNVALGEENHVRFVLQLAANRSGAMQFAVGGLKSLSAHGQYGTSLTVVDMVRNQVLGQGVLFGDSPPLQVPATDAPRVQTSNAPIVVHVAATNLVSAAGESPPRASSVLLLILMLGALLGCGLVVLQRRGSS